MWIGQQTDRIVLSCDHKRQNLISDSAKQRWHCNSPVNPYILGSVDIGHEKLISIFQLDNLSYGIF